MVLDVLVELFLGQRDVAAGGLDIGVAEQLHRGVASAVLALPGRIPVVDCADSLTCSNVSPASAST